VPYSYLGLFTRENLVTSLALSPLVPLGMYIGFAVHNKIPRDQFIRLVCAILFILGR